VSARLRFAVGTFDMWRTQATVRELTVGGMADNSFTCLPLSCAVLGGAA
jgi:hypothetical protein